MLPSRGLLGVKVTKPLPWPSNWQQFVKRAMSEVATNLNQTV
jgi:hypothetical protein